MTRQFNAIKNAVNFGKGKNTMNKFNEQKQVEETTSYETGELMNEVNKLDQGIKRTLEESSEGKWSVSIDEYYPSLGNGQFSIAFSATFNNLTTGGSHQELFNTVKACGEFLCAKVEQYYQDHPNATEQLNAEDTIDTFTMEHSK